MERVIGTQKQLINIGYIVYQFIFSFALTNTIENETLKIKFHVVIIPR